MNFNFRDKQNPYSVVTNIASAMQMYPTKHTLLGMCDVPLEYNQGAIQEVLGCLTPQQVRMMWSSKRHAGKLANTEPIYGTAYEVGGWVGVGWGGV
jgi:insulysin